MTTRDMVRLSIPVEPEFNERLKSILPYGVKAEVIRSLLELLIDAQETDPNGSMAYDLLQDKLKLVRKNDEQTA